MCFLSLSKEVFQVVYDKWEYFFDFANYVEWSLYICTILFLVDNGSETPEAKVCFKIIYSNEILHSIKIGALAMENWIICDLVKLDGATFAHSKTSQRNRFILYRHDASLVIAPFSGHSLVSLVFRSLVNR